MKGWAVLAVFLAAASPALACDPDDAVTDDRCDQGDKAVGRRPAEDWGSFYARRQAEIEHELDRQAQSGGRW